MDATATPEAAPAPQAQPQEEHRTFTQEQLNAILAENKRQLREENERLKAENDTLKPRAQMADEIEAAKKTELEKANDQLAKLQQELADRDAREKAMAREQLAKDTALKVAEKLGIPTTAALKLAGKLDGDDEEALAASAEDLLGLLKPQAAPVPAAVNDAVDKGDLSQNDVFVAGLQQGATVGTPAK